MLDQEYIRRAVELADGWEYVWDGHDIIESLNFHGLTVENIQVMPEALDSIAAQLVRQIDALCASGSEIILTCYQNRTLVLTPNICADVFGPDRTMNTIKAIVDSKLLAASGG